ncbi:unnamed protein product [Durusdinium trenchii]|uniref:Uncharacterized protein n=1 Tax=Durusdinium trenchii TaxID=1381693 RepID=A0ABP0S5H5_9DINO
MGGHRKIVVAVTLTDQQRVLPLLARNALLASTPDVSKAAEKPFAAHLKVRELSWGEQEAETFRDAEGPFDLVLCCEVVYQQPPEVWRALQETLGKLLRPGGRAVFAYQHRDGAEVTDARFFETLEEASKLQFQMEESLSEWDGVWDDLELRWVRTGTYVSRNDSSL